jgi:hypothetical protein
LNCAGIIKERACNNDGNWLSESIEKGIARTLSKAYEKLAKDRDCTIAQVEKAENLFVRVVSSLQKKQKVREGVSFFSHQ